MKLDLWFPTPVYSVMIDSHESMNPQLTEVIRQHQQQHPSIQASNMLGYHSNSDLHQEADYQGLVSELNRAMREIESQEAIIQPCELVNLWFNVNPVGSHNAEHTHPRSDWSGVYYVQTPADSLHCLQVRLDSRSGPVVMSISCKYSSRFTPTAGGM